MSIPTGPKYAPTPRKSTLTLNRPENRCSLGRAGMKAASMRRQNQAMETAEARRAQREHEMREAREREEHENKMRGRCAPRQYFL